MLPWQSAYGSTGESITNSTSHKTQALDMLCHFRERGKQKGNIGQCPRCNNPRSPLWLREKGIPHGKYRVLIRDWWLCSLGQKICAIESGVT